MWQLANCCLTATLILDARGTVNQEWGSEYLGAFLICGNIKEYYMVPVSAWGIDDWLGNGQVRINESETINVLVALCTWKQHLRGCRVNVWVDSSTTKGVITNGYSKSKVLTKMSGEIWLKADATQCGLWIHRVPTKLNPADLLSRGDDSLAREAGFSQVQPRCSAPGDWRF